MMRSATGIAALFAVALSAAHSPAADLVANRTLRAGTILAPGDLVIRGDGDAAQLETLVGQEVRRAVYAGHVILPGDLGPPTLVRRNDVVTMIFRSGALGLRTEGRALGNGGLGERVEIMNLDSRMVVRAMVTGARQVEVRR